jgi:hypothetical protein
MDLDNLQNLIPVIIFVVYLVGTALSRGKFGKKRSASPSTAAPASPPRRPVSADTSRPKTLVEKIKEVFDEAMSEYKNLSGENSSGNPSPADAPGEKQERGGAPSMPEWTAPAAATPHSTKPHPAISLRTIRAQETARHAVAGPRVNPPGDPADLRTAIVWSEILGSPVALREDA